MSEERPLLLQGDAYDNFINATKTKATKQLYVHALKKFMADQNVEHVNDLVAWDPRLVDARIISWIVHLKDKEKLSGISIKAYLAAIIFFYAMNDIEPHRKKIGKYLPECYSHNNDEAYTTKEIARLLEFCDIRSRAFVLLLASSGMRIGAVPDLQIKHLKKIDKYNLYKVIIYAGFREEHFSFTTPECAVALDGYLEYRERYGERINNDSPVIREQFDIEDQLAARHPRKMTVTALADVLRYNIYRAGIFERQAMIEGQKRGQKRNSIPRAHGFRKFVETNLIRAKVQDPVDDLLLGHDIGIKRHYLRLQEDEILMEYLKAVDLLTINEESRLKRQVTELRSDMNRLDNLQSQIETLSRQLGLEK